MKHWGDISHNKNKKKTDFKKTQLINIPKWGNRIVMPYYMSDFQYDRYIN